MAFNSSRIGKAFGRLAAACIVIALSAVAALSQELPGNIRGYKVHRAKISVSSGQEAAEPSKGMEAVVKVGEPELIDTSLTGLTFELSASVQPLGYNGKIDFLAFHDFKVNGLAVDIEEYRVPIEISKAKPVSLPKPVTIFLNTKEALRGALAEMKASKEEWLVTGRVFVFGRFKKFGLTFKRVVPVDVNVKIRNPLKQ